MDEEKKSVTLIIGWVIILIVGLLMVLGGAESLAVAYRGSGDAIAGLSSQTLGQMNPELAKAIRGRRATAATYALSCGLLIAWIAVTAYRRRQKWAWYALLSSVGAGSALSVLRIAVMDYRPGFQAPLVTLIALLIALAISYRDFR